MSLHTCAYACVHMLTSPGFRIRYLVGQRKLPGGGLFACAVRRRVETPTKTPKCIKNCCLSSEGGGFVYFIKVGVLVARPVLPKSRFGNTRLAGCDGSVVPKPVLLSAAAVVAAPAAASRTPRLSAGVAVLGELNCGLAFGSS